MKQHLLILRRQAHLFARRPALMDKLTREREIRFLVAHELLHPAAAGDFIVRRGKLSLTEFLADGREITRAVLQAGAVFLVRAPKTQAADSAVDCYLVGDLVLMALGEVELWTLPSGALEQEVTS